jgi:hypothetical protein
VSFSFVFLFPTLLSGDVIWAAGASRNPFTFSALDDVVMGGASESTFDNNTGTWRGAVTTANNGGFVGVRSAPFAQALDMSSCNGFLVKLRGGEGRRVKGTVRDSTDFNGVCWTSSFNTKKSLNPFQGGKGATTVQSIKIPFDKQIPTIFAKSIPGQVFKKENIEGIQFAYSKVRLSLTYNCEPFKYFLLTE